MMKLKSLLVTTAITASLLIPASAAQAGCYWGPDGILVVPDSGQCVIQIFPLDPLPTNTPTANPIASPAPTATPTPSLTPRPPLRPRAKPVVMSEITVTSWLLDRLLVAPNLPTVSIISETDPKFQTGCGRVGSCTLSVPTGHTVIVNVASPVFFGMTSNRDADLRLFPVPNAGTSVASYKFVANADEVFWLAYFANPFELEVRSPKLANQLSFPLSSAVGSVVDAGGFTVERLQNVEIVQSWAMSAPIVWQGLPPGLKQNADGSITGAPTRAGTYAITASRASGSRDKPVDYRFTIQVTTDITPPTITSSSAIDLTSLRYEFSPSTLPNQRSTDFYKTRVTTSNGTFVREILVDGGAKSALITGLSPSTSYNLSMVACNIAADTCSDSSAAATASTQQNPIVLRSSTSGVTTRSTWIAGSLDSMQTTIRGRTGQSFRLMNVGFGNATKAQREAFEDAFPGLQLASSGTITGTLKATNRKQEREFFQIGTVFVKFKITTTR